MFGWSLGREKLQSPAPFGSESCFIAMMLDNVAISTSTCVQRGEGENIPNCTVKT